MSEVSGRRLIDQEEPETTGELVDTLAVTSRHDLTDAQWATLLPLLPAPKRPGRPSLWSKRQLVDGIRWRIRVGAPWRDVPAGYGSWSAMYALFRRWQRDGTWQRMLTALQALADAAGRISWDVSVDSTSARRTSTPPGRGKGGSPEGIAGRDPLRAGRPCAGPLAWRVDHQAAPVL